MGEGYITKIHGLPENQISLCMEKHYLEIKSGKRAKKSSIGKNYL